MQELTVQSDGDVEIWTLNRPQRRNALTPTLVNELHEALRAAELQQGTRAVIITGAGPSFSAGADLEYLLHCADTDESPLPFLRSICDLTLAFEDSRLVIIAALNGHAVAGGLELALACDIVIAASGTLIGDGHVKNNLVPGGGSSARITGKLGDGHGRWLALTGALLPAEDLTAIGWIREIVEDPAQLLTTARAHADLCATASPASQARFKQLLRDENTAHALDRELAQFEAHWHEQPVADSLRTFLSGKSTDADKTTAPNPRKASDA